MSMPTPPPDDRAPGQTGHIADHNTISDSLAALETAVGTIENTLANSSASMPLTTAGDMLYENSAPALARLPGNPTTTRMFLRQQGNGSVSAAPAWDTLEAGDITAAGAVTLAGDLGGTTSAPEVLKIQGASISAPPGGTTAFLRADGQWSAPPGTGGGGAVSSVFGRAGAVAPVSGDYSVSQVSGAAPLANPVFTGIPAGPTASPGTSTAQLATTAFVSRALTGVLLQPSGDESGAADVAAINEIIANGGFCQLVQAPLNGTPYYVNTPLLPASGSGLKGAQPWSSSNNDTYGPAGGGASGGTTIYAVSGFTGAAIIDLTNATGTQYTGVTLEDFCIEGYSTSGRGCYGVLVDGAWGAGFMNGVCVHRPDLDCLRLQGDATSGDGPDDWHIFRCKFSASRNGYGVWTDNLPDSWFSDCESSENDLDNWWINWSTNTRLTSCKAENSFAGGGFHLVGQGYPYAALALTSCTTHLNAQDGFLFDNTGGGGHGNYQLSNCYALQDNQAGGGNYSGYRSNGSLARVMASNCFAYGAKYGAYEGGTSYGMCFTGCYLSGTTAATHDDGTNTHALVNQSPVPF